MTLSYRHLAALSLLSLAACAAETDEDVASAEGEIGSVKAYFSDAKRLDLGDLTRVSVGFASEALNDALSTSTGALRGGLRFEAPSVFAPKADPNLVLPDQYEVKALDTIVSGLAAQFGEKELGTEVNSVRLKHLESTADDFFVESAFTTSAGIGPSWSFGAGGFSGSSVTLGFNADAQLTSRVIVATKNEKLGSLLSAPLEAVKASRGFVYPRSMQDIRGMKPGEMFALRGAGQLGANFGVGAPVFVADPVGGLSYRIVVSAGVAGVVKGQIDVQLVRLAGDEVVVDVGVERGQGVSFHAGINDEWGIKGICDDGQKCLRDLDLGGKRVGLQGLVEKAVEKQVNKYLTFSIGGGGSNSSSRVSLSRFRVHMDKGGVDTQKALEQLLKFDLRLAQAMYNRDLDQREPAVTAEFDAVRAATTTTRNFGFELLGMNIYHRAVVKREGTFVLQTPDGAKSVLFDHMAKDGGWFQRKHGFARTGIAAESIDANSPTSFKSEANLFIQTLSSDEHMDNDFALDNLDALLMGIAGKDVVDTLDVYGNDLERTVWQRCPVQEREMGNHGSSTQKYWDEKCNVRLLSDPSFTAKKAQGLAAIEPKISRLAPDYQALVRQAANVRLTLQSTGIHGYDALSGPGVAVTTEVRFDDKALATLTSRSKEEYTAALRGYLGAVAAKRREVRNANDRIAASQEAEKDSGRAVERMANVFANQSGLYRQISEAEKALPTTLAGKRFVAHPLSIRFSVEGDARKMLESAVIRSTAHDRALAGIALYDQLREAADDIDADLNEEHAAFYPLIALVPAQNLEVGLTVDADVNSSWFVKRERFIKAGLVDSTSYAKGAQSSTISAGMFDLRTIIEANK